MVKIERLQEWDASIICLSVMEKCLFINLYERTEFFIYSTPLYFIVKWLNFLLITCTWVIQKVSGFLKIFALPTISSV